jgi:hypothetical protein
LDKLILILLISFCPSLLFVFVLTLWKKYQAKKNKAPFTDNFLRSPGESLFSQIQDLNEKINNSLMAFVFIPVVIGVGTSIMITTAHSMFNKTNVIIAICALIVFLVYYILKMLRLINQRRLLRLGYEGELASGQELNQLMLDGYHVYHDLQANKFNIDHIVIGPDAVYAVETKARSKPRGRNNRTNYKVISDGKKLQFPDYSSIDFIDQADRQAKWLQKWLGNAVGEAVQVKPLVLLPGWYVERSSPDGVPVLNPKVVRQFLAQKEKSMPQSLRTRINHQLEQKCRDIEPKTVQIDRQ